MCVRQDFEDYLQTTIGFEKVDVIEPPGCDMMVKWVKWVACETRRCFFCWGCWDNRIYTVYSLVEDMLDHSNTWVKSLVWLVAKVVCVSSVATSEASTCGLFC